MRKFFKLAERIRIVGLVSREGKDEPTLKPCNVVYPMDLSAEQNYFDLGGACQLKECFALNVQQFRLISFHIRNNSHNSSGGKSIVKIHDTITRRLVMTRI